MRCFSVLGISEDWVILGVSVYSLLKWNWWFEVGWLILVVLVDWRVWCLSLIWKVQCSSMDWVVCGVGLGLKCLNDLVDFE